MRIGLLTSIPTTHHAFFADWIQRWNDTGHLVFPASGPESDSRHQVFQLPRFATIESLSQSPKLRTLLSLDEIRRWTLQNRLDVLLVSTATASAAARIRRLPCPVVYFCHGLHWAGNQRRLLGLYQLAERFLLRNTAGVITMNTADFEWFGGNTIRIPSAYLPAGIGLDLDDWPRTPRPSDDSLMKLLWVGALAPRKRPQDALRVLRCLQDRGLNVELNMLGTGPLMRQVQRRAGKMKGVRVLGSADPLTHLQSSHALLHTAKWEGLARVLLEAAAVGRPAFGYDVKGVRDAPGVLTSPNRLRPEGLANLIEAWWAGRVVLPHVERSDLDWTSAQDTVTVLLKQVATTSERN